MIYAVILAGGVGSRFWPLSRALEPKQFLSFSSGRSMLEEAIYRIKGLTGESNIYIATNKAYGRKIKKCINACGLPQKNILLEPEGKNTLAPIAALSKQISGMDPEAVVVVLPCDHLMKQPDKFLKSLRIALTAARQGNIVVLGIVPDRPETGYGYVKIKSPSHNVTTSQVFKVDSFVEKPDLEKAKEFIKEKKYYWNGGIFVFQPKVMLEEIKKFAPKAHKIILKMDSGRDLYKLWHKLPSISIDYAVMQRTRRAALVPLDCGWIDMGSWQAVEAVTKKDKNGNIFKGNCFDLGSKGVIVWSDATSVATIGLSNVIIAQAKGALLVCSKDRAQDVKKIVQMLKRKNA